MAKSVVGYEKRCICMDNYEKKGYLVSDFRIFHLCDEPGEIPFHYHDFHKIIFFLNGNADYVIEGRSYHLEPRDIIFVAAGEIHRPVFLTPARPYDRIVIYIAPDFLERWSERDPQHADLSACFRLAGETEHVMHQTAHKNHDLLFHINKLEKTARGEGFANGLYTEILFMEFMIILHRSLLGHELKTQAKAVYDPKIQQVLAYIAEHLQEPLRVDDLAGLVYLSRYYLMRKFKEDTGYSIHQYIASKRLLLARELLHGEKPVTEISSDVGFADYSTFARAFRNYFHQSPTDYRESLRKRN